MASIYLLFVFILTHLVVLNSAEEEIYNMSCEPFQCANQSEMRFPYKNTMQPRNCGLYTIDCAGLKVQFIEGGHWYKFIAISESDSITFNDAALLAEVKSHRCESLESFGLPKPLDIGSVSSEDTVSLFKCNGSLDNINLPTDVRNTSCGDYSIYYTTTVGESIDNNNNFRHDHCSIIRLPTTETEYEKSRDFISLFSDEFHLHVHVNPVCIQCHNQGHQCLFHEERQSYYCATTEILTLCDGYFAGKKGVLVATIASASAGLILLVLILYCLLVRKFLAYKFIYLWKKPNQAHQNVETFLRKHGPIPTRRYSYSEVKKMTKCFTNNVGQGGYGCVFKGKLQNGQLVAVKILNQSKSNGEEFINEVATISRTSHVNIVSLLGFCFEGSKRALIYEFMSNGSLEKFITKENHNLIEKHVYLEWGTLYRISLGIARGLEYLHRGCNTRILHFDIKPHNILLDKDFTPKISDFGLAKVCTREKSIITTLDARGTVGYIAPEVFCRSFGGVSHKSDVYSYGMMVLEVVGGRKNVNVGVDHPSEIYFPHWIYKRVELDEELGLMRIMNEDEQTQVRKMIMVSLWCIQTNPSNRPTMSKVIEMLEGSLDSLEVPPKPYLSSPPRSSSTEFSSGFTSSSLQVQFSTSLG